jgi:hypothetical protein
MTYTIRIVENHEQFGDIYEDLTLRTLENEKNGIHIIGLDCEYTQNTTIIENSDWTIKKNNNLVCKLQLATKDLCIIVDLCKFKKILPNKLVQILKSESWFKVGVGVCQDLENLSFQYDLGQCSGSINCNMLARYANIDYPNLENLYNLFYKNNQQFKKLDLEDRDWSKDLTTNMIKYACDDAHISYMIGIQFLKIMYSSLNIVLNSNNCDNKYKKNKIKDKIKDNIIIVDTQPENYIGLLTEFCMKYKLRLPIYDFVKDNKNFICKLTFEYGEFNSESFTNKKDAKQNVSKKVMEFINNKI